MRLLSRERLIGTIAGFLIAVASWMVIIPLKEKIIEYSPIKNTAIIAALLLLVAWWLESKE